MIQASLIGFLVLSAVLLPAMAMDSARKMQIEVHSGKTRVHVLVNDVMYYEVIAEQTMSRGIHVLVLNQATGALMASQSFDTYEDQHASDELVDFLKSISLGRLLIFAAMDEASLWFTNEARDMIALYGSNAKRLGWRWTWAMVCYNKPDSMINEAFGEIGEVSFNSWGADTTLSVEVQLKSHSEATCDWPVDVPGRRRSHFCGKYEGYGDLCECNNPAPIIFHNDPLPVRNLDDVYVAVLASDKPKDLCRTLTSLIKAKGSDTRKMVVFIDGYNQASVEVAKLFGLKSVQHMPTGDTFGRISQHVKSSLSEMFGLYPNSKYAIVLEDGMEVAPDFFSYFSQTLPIIEKDPSVYCISAWNDQGYDHTCDDVSLIYRTETMPGRGFLITRALYEEELEKKWPKVEENILWDVWMRMEEIRKDRECIIPDVSRTFHFGLKGIEKLIAFQDVQVTSHTMNTKPDVKLRDVQKMVKPLYEVLMMDLVTKATVLDHSASPCDENFIPDTVNKVYVLYLQMETPNEFEAFKQLAQCLKLWDMDMRGYHKSAWRLFLKKNQLVIVGSPASPYSKLKPSKVVPISFRRRDEL